MNKMTRESILQMGRGAFAERADYEMRKVIDNILDPNTKATAKRKITLTLEMVPDEERSQISVAVTAKALHLHPNTARYHLDKIRRETGKDPRSFQGLTELLKELEEGT